MVSVDRLSIYGAVADGSQDLTQRAEGRPSRSTGRPVANVYDDPTPQVPSEVVSCLAQGSSWDSGAQGDLLVQQRDEKCKNLPEHVTDTD